MPGALRYREIADTIRAEIANGVHPPGAMIPPLPELAIRHGCAQNTVRAALRILTDEGLVEPRQGAGTIVRGAPAVRIEVFRIVDRPDGHDLWTMACKRAGQVGAVTALETAVERAEPAVAELLGQRAGADVLHLRLHALLNGRPAQLLSAYYPADRFDATAMDGSAHSIAAAMAAAGARPGSRDERVTARRASAEEARTLKIGTGAPVLTAESLTRDLAGESVELVKIVADPDRVELLYPQLPPLLT